MPESTPTRPSSVPAAAHWDAGDDEWILPEVDSEGRHHGLVKWWRPDGTLVCETNYEHGSPSGGYVRFHENGEVSRKGQFVDGQLHGTDCFFRSTAETSENFPRGLGEAVRRAEMDYDMGSIGAARCYDESDAQCMEDGEPFPTLPVGVPEGAHFRKREEDGEYRWVLGTVVDNGDSTIDRVGSWRWWNPEGVLVSEQSYEAGQLHGKATEFDDEGVLVEEANYKEGERHGLTKTFEEGGLTSQVTYADGNAFGLQLRRLDEEEREEGPVVSVRGEFDDDDPIGVLDYLDAQGAVVGSVDTGSPDNLEVTQAVMEADDDLADLARRMQDERHHGPALLALVRAVGRGQAPPTALQDAVTRMVHPICDDAIGRRTYFCKMLISNIQRFGGGPDKCINALFEGIRKGGDAWELMRVASATLDDMGMVSMAGEVIDGLILAAPADRAASYEFTRTLIRASQGDPKGARASALALAADDPELSEKITAYIRVFFPPWEFWPATDSRCSGLAKLTPLLSRSETKSMPELAPYRLAIQKSATRLQHHRARLLERFGEQDWIVPDLDRLLPDGPIDVPIPDSYQGSGVQHLCRQEWQRLTLLCYLAGLDEIALPEKIERRAGHVELHLVSLARLFMVFDAGPEERIMGLLADSDLVDEDKHQQFTDLTLELASESNWFGTKISDIDSLLDPDFLHADENAYVSAFAFFGNTDTDLFDEKEVDEEEYEDEDEDE